MPDSQAEELVGKFLLERDIEERMNMASAAVNCLNPDEALSLLFTSLNIAVDKFAAVLEIAISRSHLTGEFITNELQIKLGQRSSEYLDYQFRKIVEPLEES